MKTKLLIYRNSLRGALLSSLIAALGISVGWSQDLFTRITDGAMVNDDAHSIGVAWSDYDNDGDVDLFVANGFGENNLLLQNDGNGSFERVVDAAIVTDGGDSNSGVWGDLDNDGDEDLFVANFADPGSSDFLYINQGNGSFVKVTGEVIVSDNSLGNGAAWGDYDKDGYLDLIVANSGAERNFLYRNDGNGSFVRVQDSPITTEAKTSIGVSWSDADNDGDLDLTVVNRNTTPHIDFFENLGEGGFEKAGDEIPFITENSGQRDVSISWADSNNDGFLDLLITGGGNVVNRLYASDGTADLIRVPDQAITFEGPGTRTGVWADFDNDGDLDLFLAMGFFDTGANNALLLNDGAGGFTAAVSVATQQTANSWGAAAADVNNDGFMDLVVANGGFGGDPDQLPPAENNEFFRNNGNDNHWLKMKLVASNSNGSAIGAKIRVKAEIGGQERWQMREISGGFGFGSGQGDRRPNFGLGDAEIAETVRVEWPSGTVQEIHNVAVDQILQVTEPPQLTIERAVVLSWPDIAEGYVLESAASIDGPWTLVSEAPSVDGDQTTVTVKVTEDARFFQLRQP